MISKKSDFKSVIVKRDQKFSQKMWDALIENPLPVGFLENLLDYSNDIPEKVLLGVIKLFIRLQKFDELAKIAFRSQDLSEDVINALASVTGCPSGSHHIFQTLAKRTQVLPQEVLLKIASFDLASKRGGLNVHQLLVQRSQPLSDDILRAFEWDNDVMLLMLNRTDLSESICRDLFEKGNFKIKKLVVHYERVFSDGFIIELASNEDPKIRWEVAKRSQPLPDDVRNKLAKDNRSYIRNAVAARDN